ncbi:MAG: hypothetical protein U0992_04160 [Planctomycetaceae bacterium]
MKFDEAFNTFRTRLHSVDCFRRPDGRLGMFELDRLRPQWNDHFHLRLSRPFAEAYQRMAFDSGEDLNGDGVIESPDALYDDITNRQL